MKSLHCQFQGTHMKCLKSKLKKKKCVPCCLETVHGLETWELKRQLISPHIPNIQWWDRTTTETGPTEDCLKGGRKKREKSTKQSLVLRNSVILQGKCWHYSLSRRVCALTGSCLPWKRPPWFLDSVFEKSVLLSRHLKWLILQKQFMLAAEQTP